MWVFLNDAFLSIVFKDCARDELLVRARRQGDIEKIFQKAKVQRNPKGDYLFRAAVKRSAVRKAIAGEVARIAYGNFKDSIHHRPRERPPALLQNVGPVVMKSLLTIVGMKHRGTEALVAGLPKGETLILIREPTNAHDTNAVQVWARDVQIGFVKGTQAAGLAQFMDRAGHASFPAILAVTAERWPCAEVDTDSKRVVEPKAAPAPGAEVVIKEGRDV